MTGVVRWRFTDTATSDEVILPLNPKSMSTPTSGRDVSFGWSSGDALSGVDHGQGTPTTWTFDGVILVKSHDDLLLEWAERAEVIRIDDHLGRAFEVIFETYESTERKPTPTRPFKADYTMTCLLLKEVA